MSHLVELLKQRFVKHTVDSNSHDFSQDEAIRRDKCGYATEVVELLVVDADLWGSCVNELDIEFVLFGDRKKNIGAGVALRQI